MNKRYLRNLLTKEKRKYEENIKKYERLIEMECEDSPESEHGKGLESVSIISEPVASTSAGGFLSNQVECSEFLAIGSVDTESGPQAFTFVEENSNSSGNINDSVDIESGPQPSCSYSARNIDSETKREEIKSWAVRNKISQTALEDLLHTLKRVGVKDFPLSAKTLLGTSTKKINISTIPIGEFLYLGIQKYFLSGSFDYLDGKEEVSIDVGIDGLKLFKSSNRVLWPILGSIVGFANVSPFMIGCFSGFKKPKNLDSFMADFCAEVKVLQENGIKVGYNQNLLRFKVRLFVCDSPARAFVTGVVSHNGKNGCPKCCQEGLYKERRVCFLKEVGTPRTDITFQSRCNPSHHIEEFKVKKSILEESGFEMVSQFPLDPTHKKKLMEY